MTKKMLIDATHDEETRVAVVDGNRLVEFDYESKLRKALKGSIFLAKVTRVEPSLQAAFVNFGGNRHGFLPFSEIHPDYFRIPIADREALIAEQEAAMAEDEEAEEQQQQQEEQAGATNAEAGAETPSPSEGPETVEDEGKDMIEEIGGGKEPAEAPAESFAEAMQDDGAEDAPEDVPAEPEPGNMRETEEDPEDSIGNRAPEDAPEGSPAEMQAGYDGQQQNDGRRGGGRHRRGRRGGRGRHRDNRGGGGGGDRAQHRSRRTEKYDDEQQSSGDRFRFSLRRKYKIQEVIKRGQIMLVQVSKEERGNKGAAVSSYLSLPGRYCVLMPNSPRGGGVSRKISNYQDRAKMREIMKDLEVPKGMSVIVRTAGVSRTKAEVKRDLDYLMRLWDNIRELTLQSTAPALVYEEANLIKRAVRDLYGRDVEDIHVSGEEGFKQARDFMKMMMPSHVKKVHQYEDDTPLFTKYKVEAQIADIGEPRVNLPSGGYLIFNPTEALVAIDVNSGKSTKERHIEETATRTNTEAAEEIARQLRMRDLGGLIVIDFIDMEDRRNNGKVERKMREALSTDRARIQMGRISSFGLMELSRQRLNPSLTESQYETCSRCSGLGRVRTADATSIMVMRAVEDEGMKGRATQVIVHVPREVANYILNNKRKYLSEMEARYSFTVLIRVDETIDVSAYRVEVSRPNSQQGGEETTEIIVSTGEGNAEGHTHTHTHRPDGGEERQDGGERRGGRRRGRRGGRRRGGRGRDENGGGGRDQRPHSNNPSGFREEQSLADALDQDSGEDFDSSPGNGAEDSFDNSRQADSFESEQAPEPSNDHGPTRFEKPESSQPRQRQAEKREKPNRDYEKINEAPGEKKKGWWNRISGE